MDIENQKITIAIKEGETPDIQAMFKAILSGGYEPVFCCNPGCKWQSGAY